MTNNSTCALSTRLANDLAFTLSNYVLLTMGFTSAVLNLVLVMILRRAKHLDHNVSVLLANMSFATIVSSAYQFLKAIYVIIKATKPCGLVMNILTCKLVEVVYLSSGLGVIWSALAMAIDRLVATKKPDSYSDDWGRIIPAFIGISWTSALLLALITATILDDNDADVIHCNIIFVAPLCLEIPIGIIAVLTELILAVIFFSVWLYNRRYLKDFGSNTATTSLRARYQLHRNMRAARMMLPSISVHCGIWVIIATGGIAARLSQMPLVEFFMMGQYGSDGLVLLHALLHPLICFLLNEELLLEIKGLLRHCRRHSSENSIVAEVDNRRPLKDPAQTTYFEMLTKSWGNK